jgi:hypothetical protein
MTNKNTGYTIPTRKNHISQGWLSLLTFGVVVLIFALVAYQIGHEVASNIKVATEVGSPASLPVETQPVIVASPTGPALPPTVPAQSTAEVALPASNKPQATATSTPVPAKSTAPAPTAKPAVPAQMQQKPAAPASSSSKPRPTTKPS